MRRKPFPGQQIVTGALLLGGVLASRGQPLSISTLAGTGSIGYADGAAGVAKFADPSGVAVDRATNIFVADTFSNVVRLIAADGTGTNWVVSTLAGTAGVAGHVDGTNGGARFSGPAGLATDGTNVYVADTGNNQIRRVARGAGTNWVVSTIAGTSTAEAGAADGTNGAAQFSGPSAVAIDGRGRLFVADGVNNTVRELTPDATGTNWVVTTFAGTAGAAGNKDGLGGAARFSSPNSLAFDTGTNLYVADGGNCTVRMITPAGQVTTIAGGTAGLADGVGTNAQFDFPCGIAVDAATNVFVADFYNCTVRRLTRGSGGWAVTTVAGSAPNPGRSDGVATLARFQFSNARGNPNGLACDAGGRIYIADSANCRIRTGTVYDGLIFLATAGNQAAVAGATVTLGASAAGAMPIGYQWLRNGVAVAGATNATLVLTNALTNASGSYVLEASNTAGVSNSPPAVVTIVLPLAVWTAAGVGAVGYADGYGLAARFNGIGGVAVDSAGNVLVADAQNDVIRKVALDGSVTTLAGMARLPGRADGASDVASFRSPYGVAADARGNVFVADTGNSLVREISSAGVVATVAGTAGGVGFRDGPAGTALLGSPYGVAVDGAGVVYIADTLNNRIRVVANGYVTTLAGDGAAGAVDAKGTNAEFDAPYAVAVDGAGSLFVADYGSSIIRKVTPAGNVTTIAGAAGQSGYANGTGGAALFSLPSGIAVDAQENVYVGDYGNQVLRRLTPSSGGAWTATTPAGFPQVIGDSDGTALGARFHGPFGISVDSLGFVYVGDSANEVVRKVTPGGTVSTLAGPAHSFGVSDGAFPGGRLNGPRGVAMDAGGNIYAADSVNNTIRLITPTGNMSTIAGLAGFGGANNGAGSAARFSDPTGLAVDAETNVYVADFQGSIVRKMMFDAGAGAWVVGTLAGRPGAPGFANGVATNAQFNGPWGVAVGAGGNVYVSDYSNQVIRLITAAGMVSTYAGSVGHAGYGDGMNAFFNYPTGMALDSAGNLYVADSQNELIRKIAPGGNVSTVAGTYFVSGSADGNGLAARFNTPEGLAVDALGNIFVADTGNNVIREITANGGVVTAAAMASVMGSRDGAGSAAEFDGPIGLALGPGGTLVIADTQNNTIREAGGYYGQALVLTPPFGRTVPAGAPLSLTGNAVGTAPLSLQWLDNGGKLAGATNLGLTLATTQAGNAASYQLAASNVYGAVTSAVAVVSVSQPPQILAQSGNQMAAAGSSPTLAVSAFGAGTLSYQWSFEGAALAGKTNPALTIANMQAANVGAYQVIVSSAFGSATSLVTEVTLAAAPQFVAGLSNVVGQCGSNVVLTASVSGSAPISYQWLAGSSPIELATLPSLAVSNLVDGQAQYFAVVASNAFGVVTSRLATVNVTDSLGPVITLMGAETTNILTGGVFNDPGATALDLCSGPESVVGSGSVNTSIVGTYVIAYRASDAAGNFTTNTRTVRVVPAAPEIFTQPVSQTNYPGATQVFEVAVTGQEPMAFQWSKNGAKILGATNEELAIGPLSAADAGSYKVTVSNGAGAVVSSNAVLSIGAAGIPVAVMGFNRDVVVENASFGANTASYAQAFDPTYPTFCFYESGLLASNVYGTSPTNLGLNVSGAYVSAADGATEFQLAPYTANNVLYLTALAPTASLDLAVPTNFNALSILAASADGGGSGVWSVQFTDGTTGPSWTLNAADWQGTSGGAVTHFGLLYYGNYGQFYAYNLVNNFPSLYQTTVDLAELELNTKKIAALTFTKPAGASLVTGIFAVSGTVGPAELRFIGPELSGGELTFHLQTVSGQSYTLQETTNLETSVWESFSNFAGTGADWILTVPMTNRQEFFRVAHP